MYEFYRYKSKLENAGLMNAGNLSILEIRRKNKELTNLLKAIEKYNELVDMPLDLLFTVNYEIRKKIDKGYTPLESMMIVANTGIGIELVLLAQSFLQEERYNFDMSTLNILDLRNVVRLLTWDVYTVDKSKNIYNVTPRCK